MSKIIGKIKKPLLDNNNIEILKLQGIFTFTTHLGYTNSDGTIYIPKYSSNYNNENILKGSVSSAILINNHKNVYLFGEIPMISPYRNNEDMISIDYYVCPNGELAIDLVYNVENEEWMCTDINGSLHYIDYDMKWHNTKVRFPKHLKY